MKLNSISMSKDVSESLGAYLERVCKEETQADSSRKKSELERKEKAELPYLSKK